MNLDELRAKFGRSLGNATCIAREPILGGEPNIAWVKREV